MQLPHGDGFRLRVGVDIVEVDRVARLVARGAGAQARMFTSGELDYCLAKARRNEHLAARVAAKEAVFKIFGDGIRHAIRWTEVEVVNSDGGRPSVRLHGELASVAKREKLVDIDLSLSHTNQLAIAYAVAVCGQSPEIAEGGL